MQLELIEHVGNKSKFDLMTDRLKQVIDIRSLNDRVEAGAIIKEIKENKLFKDRYKYFKTYCDKALNQKSTRVDYILKFYNGFKDMETFLKPLPITIDQVNALMFRDNEFIKKLWNLTLIRFNNDLNLITEIEITDLKMWLIGLEPLKLKQDDNRNFLKNMYKLQFEKTQAYSNEVLKIRKEISELENKYNQLKRENIYNNKSDYEFKIKYLESEVQSYKSMYELEHAINQMKSKTNSFNSYSFNTTSKSNYDILGLKDGCSKSDIKKAFRTLSLEYHPDKLESLELSSVQKQLFTDKFLEIKKAYDTLSK